MAGFTLDRNRLRQIPVFSEVSDSGLNAIQRYLKLITVPEGELIFSEGQRGDQLYIVLEGAVQIVRQIEGVGEEQLAVCRENSFFGELSMIDARPRSADARVIESARLLVIRKSDLEELMFGDKELEKELLWIFVHHLTTRLRETNEKLRALYQMNL